MTEGDPTRRAALIGLASFTVAATAVGIGLHAHRPRTHEFRLRTDNGFSTLQQAVDACGPGDALQIQRAWSIGVPVRIDKALTISCAGRGAIATTADVHALNISASDVVLANLRITGNGGSVAGTQSLIRATGTAHDPLSGLVVRNCTLTESSKHGVELHNASEFSIEGNTVREVAYAGVMILSGSGGQVVRNDVRNVVQPQGFVNSYGIALTRNAAEPLSSAPRTTGTLVLGNTIDGVPNWEAIDTHAGVNVTIAGNSIRNVFVGIAVVPGRDESGTYRLAPKGVTVKDNTVDSGVRNGTRRAGIQLVGAGNPSRVEDYAQGVISENTVIGFGHENYSSGAGIVTSCTQKSAVKGNVLEESSISAVLASHNNLELMIEGNTMIDTWTNSLAFTACVYVDLPRQSVTVRNNRARRATKMAKRVNDAGALIASAAKYPSVAVAASGNDFSACARPLVDETGSHGLA